MAWEYPAALKSEKQLKHRWRMFLKVASLYKHLLSGTRRRHFIFGLSSFLDELSKNKQSEESRLLPSYTLCSTFPPDDNIIRSLESERNNYRA